MGEDVTFLKPDNYGAMINSIELENWKTHGRTTMNFSKGTNILIGHMGAGKSSVLDALSFALFGTFPSIKNRRIKVEDIIRSKPKQTRTARLKLDFDANGSKYTVERTLSLDEPAKAALKKDGAYVQSQPQRVTEEVEKVLKIDYELFSRAVYSEQNRVDYFLEISSSDRKRQIDNLLGLDRFALAYENSTSLINRVKNMIEDSEKAAKNFDIKRLNDQITQLSLDLDRASAQNIALEQDTSSILSSKTSLEKELLVQKALLDKKVKIEKEVAEFESRIAVLEKELSSTKTGITGTLDDINKRISASEVEIAGLQKEISRSSLSMQSLQIKLGKLQKELSDIEKNKKEKDEVTERFKGKTADLLRHKIEFLSKEVEALDGEYAQQISLKHESEKSLLELKKHLAKCPVCDTELSEEKRLSLITAKTTALKESESKSAAALRLRTEKKSAITALNSELNSMIATLERISGYGDLDKKFASCAFEIKKLSDELEISNTAFKQINYKLAEENSKLSSLRLSKAAAERANKLSQDIQKNKVFLDSKKADLSGIVVDNALVEELQAQYLAVNSEFASKKMALEEGKKAYAEKAQRLSEKKEEMKRIESLVEELNLKKLSLDELSKFRNALSETQSALRKRLVSSVNDIMESIWPNLYPYGDYAGIMLSATDDDYVLQLRSLKDGEYVWENVNSTASGGERSIACIVMRIAFSLVLVPNLRWLILDEPTHNIDSNGIAKFVRLLNENLPGIIEQIFIITHDEQLKQVSSGTIYSLSREKEINGTSIVQEL